MVNPERIRFAVDIASDVLQPLDPQLLVLREAVEGNAVLPLAVRIAQWHAAVITHFSPPPPG